MTDPVWSEEDRLKALYATGILDTLPEDAFDDIARIASLVCKTPVGLISFVETDRQWFKAEVGLGARQTTRNESVCAIAMLEPGVLVVPDLTEDPRFCVNPLVTGEPRLRFYAGARIVSPEGLPLGMVCAIDFTPRPQGLTVEQTQVLLALANHVGALLALRVKTHALGDSEARFRVMTDAMPQMVWSTQPDGFHDYYNARWYEFTGVAAGSTDGEGWNDMFHPEDQDRAWEAWRRSLATGEPYEIEYRLRRADGVYRWTLGRALPLRDASGAITRWFGTCTDIDDNKRAAEERDLIGRELSHRIKNIFAVISGIVSLAARRDPSTKTFAADVRARIMSLGRAHDHVRPQAQAARQLASRSTAFALLREILEPYSHQDEDRIVLQGDDITIDHRAATPLALVFHELATNAAKYGALMTAEGRVSITGQVDAAAYTLTWSESGGPLLTGPAETDGFGSVLTAISVEGQLAGTIHRDWRPTGLQVTVRAPLSSFSLDAAQ